MKNKKRMNKERIKTEIMIENEKNMRRLQVLKELELISKPKNSKNNKEIHKLEVDTEKSIFYQEKNESKTNSLSYLNNSNIEFKGNFEFIEKSNEFEESSLKPSENHKENPEFSNKNQKVITEKPKSALRLKISESSEQEIKRPNEDFSNYSENYENEEFEIESGLKKSQSFEENLNEDQLSQEFEGSEEYDQEEFYQGSEEFNNFREDGSQQEEFVEYSDEEEFESSENEENSGNFEKSSEDYEKKEKVIEKKENVIDKKEKVIENNRKVNENIGKVIENNLKVIKNTENFQKTKFEPENYPGNSKITGGFEKFLMHPSSSKAIEKSLPYALTQPNENQKIILSQKESIRTQLADLSKKQEKPSHFEKIEVADDLEINLYKIPGILETDKAYELSEIYSNVQVFRAASKIQAWVRGFLTRRNLIRIQHNIPSNQQINKDIHGILLKYYPEAYVPEFFGSSYIPESISMAKFTDKKDIAINTAPPQSKDYIKLQIKEADEYNLINILAKEMLLEHPDISLDGQSYQTEEVYSEEFESVSEEIFSNHSRYKISNNISESIKESILDSKFHEKTSRSKHRTGSIPESIEESKDFYSESIQSYKNKNSQKFNSGSIKESIQESFSSPQSIQETTHKNFKKSYLDSGSGVANKSSDIPEEYEEFRKTGSVKFADEEICEEFSSQKKIGSKQSYNSIYEDDFESVSSENNQRNIEKYEKNHEKDLSKFANKVKPSGITSAKILEDQLVSGLDALDRARAREYEIDAMIFEKKLKIDQEIKRQALIAQRNQEIIFEKINKEKDENLDRFQVFMTEIMRQQKESFAQITETIAKTLQNIPFVVRQQENIEKS